MGREAPSEPRRLPAYGRRGPGRWRSKGQRAETAGQSTVGNEVPPPPAPASTRVDREFGRPDERPERQRSGSPAFQNVWSHRGQIPTRDLRPEGQIPREKYQPSYEAEKRSPGNEHASGNSLRNLSGKMPLDCFHLFGWSG